MKLWTTTLIPLQNIVGGIPDGYTANFRESGDLKRKRELVQVQESDSLI